MADHPRRFPRPWTVEETYTCFTVLDANGQKLAYVYFENQPGRRAAAKLLSYDEARRQQGEAKSKPVRRGIDDPLRPQTLSR
jgi:hypothetical protein